MASAISQGGGGCCCGECCEFTTCVLHHSSVSPEHDAVSCLVCTGTPATLTFDGAVFGGNPFSLTWNGGTETWTSSCVELDGFWWKVEWRTPGAGTFALVLTQYSAAGCDAGDLVDTYSVDNGQWTSVDCSPYSSTWPAPLNASSDPPYEDMTETVITHSGHSCPQITFQVWGCGTLSLPGATVTVWTDGSKTTLLDSGITDEFGFVTLTWTGGYCAGYYEVAYSGFETAAGEFDDLSESPLVIMEPAEDYICCGPCGVVPAPKVLSASTPDGNFTLTYSATDNAYLGCLSVEVDNLLVAVGGAGGCICTVETGMIDVAFSLACDSIQMQQCFGIAFGSNCTPTSPYRLTISPCVPGGSVVAPTPTDGCNLDAQTGCTQSTDVDVVDCDPVVWEFDGFGTDIFGGPSPVSSVIVTV